MLSILFLILIDNMTVDIKPEDLNKLKKTAIQKWKAWASAFEPKRKKFLESGPREALTESTPTIVAEIAPKFAIVLSLSLLR